MQLEDFTYLALVGLVSSGKSTFATSLGITTANTGEKRTTMAPNVYIFTVQKFTKDEKATFAAKIARKFGGVDKADIHWAKNVLEINNLIVVDLPGFDDASNNDKFKKLILDTMEIVDYILCISTITAFSTGSFMTHMEEIKEKVQENNAKGHFNELITVINKVDDPLDIQAVESINEIKKEHHELEIFRFSSIMHRMYCLNKMSTLKGVKIDIHGHINVSELKTQLTVAGANRTAAYGKVMESVKYIIYMQKSKQPLENYKITLNIEDFAGEMLNLENGTGDHDRLRIRLTGLNSGLKIKRDMCQTKRLATQLSALASKIDEDRSIVNEFRRLANTAEDTTKTSGAFFAAFSVEKINKMGTFIMICDIFVDAGYKSPNMSVYECFLPIVWGLRGPMGELEWIQAHIFRLMATDYKNINDLLAILKAPKFWAPEGTMLDEFGFEPLARLMHFSFESDSPNAKICQEILKFGALNHNDYMILFIHELGYLRNMCKLAKIDLVAFIDHIISEDTELYVDDPSLRAEIFDLEASGPFVLDTINRDIFPDN